MSSPVNSKLNGSDSKTATSSVVDLTNDSDDVDGSQRAGSQRRPTSLSLAASEIGVPPNLLPSWIMQADDNEDDCPPLVQKTKDDEDGKNEDSDDDFVASSQFNDPFSTASFQTEKQGCGTKNKRVSTRNNFRRINHEAPVKKITELSDKAVVMKMRQLDGLFLKLEVMSISHDDEIAIAPAPVVVVPPPPTPTTSAPAVDIPAPAEPATATTAPATLTTETALAIQTTPTTQVVAAVTPSVVISVAEGDENDATSTRDSADDGGVESVTYDRGRDARTLH